MAKITLGVLSEKIANLSEKIEQGFEGVHKRQDIANNRTSKQEERSNRHKKLITDLEKTDIKIYAKIKTTRLFWMSMATLVTIIFTLCGFIFGKYY